MIIKQLTLTERKSRDRLIDIFKSISSIDYVQRLVDSLPYLGAILNGERQIVFANQALLSYLGLDAFEKILGRRPGEAVNCINSTVGPDGCGTAKNCVVCGALNSIYESQLTKKQSVKECRISSFVDGKNIAYDFKVTSTPFELQNNEFTLFALEDISSEKRKRSLEKIFFHDVLNKTSSIYGFLELLKHEKEEDKIKQFIDILTSLNKDLADEILAQRELLAAENNELKVQKNEIEALELLHNLIEQLSASEFNQGKKLTLATNAENISLVTDHVLLKRTLTNMLKNALEATKEGDEVTIGVNDTGSGSKFWVKNNSVIEPEVQMQIFQRSFSTKSDSRGIGTYSMKIIGENYLGGKVDFLSNDTDKTIFSIEIPKS